MTNQTTYRRVPHTEKSLNILDATLPSLILADGAVLSNFDYFATASGTFIRALDEYGLVTRPTQLWNFAGKDLRTYSNDIVELEYDADKVRAAHEDVYPDASSEEIDAMCEAYHQRLLGNDTGMCDARKNLTEGFEKETQENQRRQDLLQRIADQTANDPDALPSPEVMQLRMDEAKRLAESEIKLQDMSIVTPPTGLITGLHDAPLNPPKIIL